MFTAAAGCLALSLVASAYGALEIFGEAQQRAEREAAEEAERAKDPYGLGFVVEDSERDLVVKNYEYGDLLHYLYVSGSDYYDLCFDHAASEATPEKLKGIIAGNSGIPEGLKGKVCEFVDAVAEAHPSVDLRVLEHNLASLEIVECSPEEMREKAGDHTAGRYSALDNRILISSANGYEEGTWDYQLLPHELCHAMRRAVFALGELDVSINPDSPGIEVVDEAFTSIMVDDLGYGTGGLSYQPEVNMVRVMLECVDGYEFYDYYRQSLRHFAAKLDETSGDHNYAIAVFRLMQAQYDDFNDDGIYRDLEAYRPIYDYLVRIYLDEHAAPGMSAEEVDRTIGDLAERVAYRVSYDHDVGELYRFGREYYEERYGR